MIKQLNLILSKKTKPYIYISLDVDIGALKEILAARFINTIGIEKKIILDAAKNIKKFIDKNKIEIVGLDVMEIETHVLGKELKKSGRQDKTIEVVDDFLRILFID